MSVSVRATPSINVLHRLSPLPARGVTSGDFTGPGTRHVLWWPCEEDDWLPWVRCPNLLVEFERFRRGVSANVEHDETVDMGLPQKSRAGDLFSFIHLDSATPEDRSARFARSLKAIDEENFLVSKNRATTQWRRAIHISLPKRARPLWEERFGQSLRRERMGVNIIIKST